MIPSADADPIRHLKNRTTPFTLPHSKRVVDDTAPDVLVIETEDGVDYYEETTPGEWCRIYDSAVTARIFAAMAAQETP